MEVKQDKWEEQGVTFVIIEEKMFDNVIDFMWENFFPDEPLSRSLNIKRGWMVDILYLKESLKDKSSIAAVNKDEKILGVRIGNVVKKNEWIPWMIEAMAKASIKLNVSFMPKGLNVYSKIIKVLEFDTYAMFEKLNCQTIYEDKALCSARFHSIKGLGAELLRRTDALAASLGCSHTIALVTGKYSALVFNKLGHTELKSLEYANFKDPEGNLYLKDVREHTHCRVFMKALQ